MYLNYKHFSLELYFHYYNTLHFSMDPEEWEEISNYLTDKIYPARVHDAKFRDLQEGISQERWLVIN